MVTNVRTKKCTDCVNCDAIRGFMVMLAVAGIGAAVAANPIREGNMISGHVLVKGSEENIPVSYTHLPYFPCIFKINPVPTTISTVQSMEHGNLLPLCGFLDVCYG